jgi:ABC-type dipeptide/oligopeptide/nickel transport system permease subunit
MSAAHAPSLPARLGRRLVGLARRSPTMAIGAAIILVFALLAIFHGTVMPHDPVRAYPSEVLKPPSARFWFGTDGNGMDVFSRVIYGSLYAFGIAVPSVAIGLALGVPIGLWTGYKGGLLDETTMRIFDALRVFPIIILALAIVAATGQSLVNVIFVIGLIDAPIFVRVVRAEVLALRSSNFVEARSATRPGASSSCTCCRTRCAARSPRPRCARPGPCASAPRSPSSASASSSRRRNGAR